MYLYVKFRAINGDFDNILGDINQVFSESQFLNNKQKALITGLKGYVIAKTSNLKAGKDLVYKGLDLDKHSYFCYYFLAKINLIENDTENYNLNINLAKQYDVYNEIKYE
jgi:hypothetical protein